MHIFSTLGKRTSEGRPPPNTGQSQCRWGKLCCCRSSGTWKKHSLCTRQERTSNCPYSKYNWSTEGELRRRAGPRAINWRGKCLIRFFALPAEKTHRESRCWLECWLLPQRHKQLGTSSAPSHAARQCTCCSSLLFKGPITFVLRQEIANWVLPLDDLLSTPNSLLLRLCQFSFAFKCPDWFIGGLKDEWRSIFTQVSVGGSQGSGSWQLRKESVDFKVQESKHLLSRKADEELWRMN